MDGITVPVGSVGTTSLSTGQTTVAPSITMDSLQPASPVVLPTPTQSPDTTGGIIAGANQTSDNVNDYISKLTPASTALDQQQQGLLNDISTLTGQDSGKAQAYLDAEKASGATQANADLTALNGRLKTMTASYDQMEANLGGNGAPETKAVLAAQNAGLLKARAADIGMVTAQIQAKQGDLTLATKTAHDSVDARYSTIEDNIKTKQAQLNALLPSLNAQEKAQALAQTALLEKQKQEIADQKAAEKANLKVSLDSGITSRYANQNGRIFDTTTGKDFTNANDFYKASGVSSFEEAYQKGLIQDVKNTNLTFETKTISGQQVRIGFDKTGKMVSQTVLGPTKGTPAPDQKAGTVTTYQTEGGKLWKVTTKGGVQVSKVEQKPTSGKTPSPANVAGMLSDLTGASGQDHAVSPEVWDKNLSDWLDAGFTLSSFKSNFGTIPKNSTNSKLSEYKGM